MRNLEKEQEFKQWLKENRYDDRTIDSRITNCKKVNEKYDLYEYFTKGNTQEIYRLFTYTTKDMDNGLKPLHNIPINGNPYTGTHTYKSAIKLYFAFLAEEFKEKETFGNIFMEEAFKAYLPKNGVEKSVSNYLNYIKNVDRLFEYKLFPIIKEIYESQNFEALNRLREQGDDYLAETFKGLKNLKDYRSGFKKYLYFIEDSIADVAEAAPDTIDKIVNDLVDEEIDEVTTEIKDSYTHEDIRKNFFFRLISQNRFNQKSDFYFPIRFIQQYFYKTNDKEYFNNIINKQIDGIRFFYDKNSDEFKHLKELKISEDGKLLINDKVVFSEDFKNNSTYVPFEVTKLSDIAIDHIKPMDTILSELKKADYCELEKITTSLNKGLHSRTYKKLAARGTKLSNNDDFINSIDKAELKREFEDIVNRMQLQLMHKKHNSDKRNKVK